MSPIVDLGNVKGQEPIPADWYDAEVESAKEGTSKQGFEKISIGYRIVDGPYEKRMVFDDLSFAPNALPITKDKLVGLGYASDFEGEVTAEDLIGTRVRIKVAIESSTDLDPETGEPWPPRNRIKKIKATETSVSDLLK